MAESKVPANVISGFKTCVEFAYLFNPKEVLDHDHTKEIPKEDDRVPTTDDHKIGLHDREETSDVTTFTAEEETLFTRWYQNGYNIPDPWYVHCES